MGFKNKWKRQKIDHEYVISKAYYRDILDKLRKDNPKANHKTVVEYFNQTARVLGGITRVRYV